MRTIIFIVVLALAATTYTQTGQPVTATAPPIQPEAPGGSPCSHEQGSTFFISTDAYYQATLLSPNSPRRHISLSLTPKHYAEMITDFLDAGPASIDTGAWSVQSNGNLLLSLRRKGQKDSLSLEFKIDEEKLVYTGDAYGSAPPMPRLSCLIYYPPINTLKNPDRSQANGYHDRESGAHFCPGIFFSKSQQCKDGSLRFCLGCKLCNLLK